MTELLVDIGVKALTLVSLVMSLFVLFFIYAGGAFITVMFLGWAATMFQEMFR